MISDHAFELIKQETERQGQNAGVLNASLYLYRENYKNLQMNEPTWPSSRLESTLLLPTNISTLVMQGDIQFREQARKATVFERAKISFWSAVWNVFLNIIANIIFIVLSLMVYFSAQDTSRSLFEKLGIEFSTRQNDEPAQAPSIPSQSENNTGPKG